MTDFTTFEKLTDLDYLDRLADLFVQNKEQKINDDKKKEQSAFVNKFNIVSTFCTDIKKIDIILDKIEKYKEIPDELLAKPNTGFVGLSKYLFNWVLEVYPKDTDQIKDINLIVSETGLLFLDTKNDQYINLINLTKNNDDMCLLKETNLLLHYFLDTYNAFLYKLTNFVKSLSEDE